MRNALHWALAVLVTLAAAAYQRITGPTYPIRGKTIIAGTQIKFRLPRSAENTTDTRISVVVPDVRISGRFAYRRLGTADSWMTLPFERRDSDLVAFLPKQPAAGKIAYRVILLTSQAEVSLTGETPVIIRFKGHVPVVFLVPHILIMFLAMLFSTRAGLAALDQKKDPLRLARWAAALMFVGGFIFGPMIQKFAFGVWWSGFPMGNDLTDSKTLAALLVWIIALSAGRKKRSARGWIIAASLITLAIFIIPHSLGGSEFKYR